MGILLDGYSLLGYSVVIPQNYSGLFLARTVVICVSSFRLFLLPTEIFYFSLNWLSHGFVNESGEVYKYYIDGG